MTHTAKILGAAAVLVLACIAQAKDTTATGDWDDATKWSGGDGNYPISGDPVNLGHNMTVTLLSGPQAFGDAGVDSNWLTGGLWLYAPLTHDTGSTLWFRVTAIMVLNGDAQFIQKGTFNFDSTKQLTVQIGSEFVNEGVFDFLNAATTSNVYLVTTTSTFTNKGTIRRSVSGTAVVGGGASSMGVFISESGSTLEATLADSVLFVGTPNGSGLASTNSVVNNTFAGAGTIGFGGMFSEISGTVTGTGSVELNSTYLVTISKGTIVPISIRRPFLRSHGW